MWKFAVCTYNDKSITIFTLEKIAVLHVSFDYFCCLRKISI